LHPFRKYIQIYIDLQKGKKKSQVFKLIYIELERDYAEMVFKQISSPSRKVSHLLVLMVGVGE